MFLWKNLKSIRESLIYLINNNCWKMQFWGKPKETQQLLDVNNFGHTDNTEAKNPNMLIFIGKKDGKSTQKQHRPDF